MAAPLPLPNVRDSLPSDDGLRKVLHNLLPRIRAEINAIIKDQYAVDFYHVSKPEYPKGNVKILTLCVKIYKGREQPHGWPELRDALKRLLHTSGFHTIDVEIVDELRAFMPSIFPQPVQKELTEVYESVRDHLLDLFNKQLGSAWNRMSLFKFGRTEDESIPSIVVFVEPFTSQNWQWLEATVREIVAPIVPPGEDLGVEFLTGRLSHSEGKNLVGKSLLRQDLSGIQMGSSIGLRGSDSTGTMGGFLTLKVGGRIHQGFLTNHHVIRSELEKQDTQKLSREGYQYTLTDVERPMIQYPSPKDLEATRSAILSLTNNSSEIINVFQEMHNTRSMKGQDPESKIEEYRQSELNILNDLHNQLKAFNEDFPINLGSVLVSSGDLVNSDGAILDWAFVEIRQSLAQYLGHRFPFLNELPCRNDPQLMNKPSPGAGVYIGPRMGQKPMIATEFGSMIKGNWYLKKGRTSGITAGICNGTEVEINRTGQSDRYTETGEKCKLGQQTTRELIILSYENPGKNSLLDLEKVQAAFSMKGDSGAFVVDSMGIICGLLYGQHDNLCGEANRNDVGAGLVTSMTDVLSSIAKKTTFQDNDGNIFCGEVTLPPPR